MRLLKVFSVILLSLGLGTAYGQIPDMNQAIKDYVTSVMGTKVDRGECWDLAHDALELVNADWNHQYIYGKTVVPGKDSIYPGDIIQFEKVTLKYSRDNSIFTESYPHHTAIVYEVIAPGEYKIAHQNTGFAGKKVAVSTLRLADKKSGKISFFRPTNKL
jgi:hypothetical protein